jgi:hypothetical protein
MTTATGYVGLKKLQGPRMLLIAARHNLRDISSKVVASRNIDHTRTPLNQILAGASSAHEITRHATSLIAGAKLRTKLRHDAVRAVEIVISLPATTSADTEAFFDDALAWVKRTFPIPLLSAVIHRDEGAPHCHFLLLPLIDGHMRGSQVMGNAARLTALHLNFHEQVGARYGLKAPVPKKRLSPQLRTHAATSILDVLRKNPHLLDDPALKQIFQNLRTSDLEALLAALHIKLDAPHSGRGMKRFIEIMTKSCRPEKATRPTHATQRVITPPSPHDSGVSRIQLDEQSLSCVGFTPKNSVSSRLGPDATAIAEAAHADPCSADLPIDAVTPDRQGAGAAHSLPIAPMADNGRCRGSANAGQLRVADRPILSSPPLHFDGTASVAAMAPEQVRWGMGVLNARLDPALLDTAPSEPAPSSRSTHGPQQAGCFPEWTSAFGAPPMPLPMPIRMPMPLPGSLPRPVTVTVPGLARDQGLRFPAREAYWTDPSVLVSGSHHRGGATTLGALIGTPEVAAGTAAALSMGDKPGHFRFWKTGLRTPNPVPQSGGSFNNGQPWPIPKCHPICRKKASSGLPPSSATRRPILPSRRLCPFPSRPGGRASSPASTRPRSSWVPRPRSGASKKSAPCSTRIREPTYDEGNWRDI